jgi:hypothetical protein
MTDALDEARETYETAAAKVHWEAEDWLGTIDKADLYITALEVENEELKSSCVQARRAEAAEERVKELEAEVEGLKCCGNCGHIELEHDPCDYRLACDMYFPGQEWVPNDWPASGRGSAVVDFGNRCHFTPSRWTTRGEKAGA